MSRIKNSVKTGGRIKGTPNKKSLFLNEALSLANFDFVYEFKKLYSEVDSNKRADLLMKLMEYCFPKRKSLDDSIVVNLNGIIKEQESSCHDLSNLSLDELKQLKILTLKMQTDDTSEKI